MNDEFDIEKDIDPKILALFKKKYDSKQLSRLGSIFGEIKKEVERDKTLMLVPEKMILAENICQKIKDVLDECKSKYEITVEKNPLFPNIAIKVLTDDFRAIDKINDFKYAINEIDEIGFRICDYDKMAINFVIYNAYIELLE